MATREASLTEILQRLDVPLTEKQVQEHVMRPANVTAALSARGPCVALPTPPAPCRVLPALGHGVRGLRQLADRLEARVPDGPSRDPLRRQREVRQGRFPAEAQLPGAR
jgi:hypothetical protein